MLYVRDMRNGHSESSKPSFFYCHLSSAKYLTKEASKQKAKLHT